MYSGNDNRTLHNVSRLLDTKFLEIQTSHRIIHIGQSAGWIGWSDGRRT